MFSFSGCPSSGVASGNRTHFVHPRHYFVCLNRTLHSGATFLDQRALNAVAFPYKGRCPSPEIILVDFFCTFSIPLHFFLKTWSLLAYRKRVRRTISIAHGYNMVLVQRFFLAFGGQAHLIKKGMMVTGSLVCFTLLHIWQAQDISSEHGQSVNY